MKVVYVLRRLRRSAALDLSCLRLRVCPCTAVCVCCPRPSLGILLSVWAKGKNTSQLDFSPLSCHRPPARECANIRLCRGGGGGGGGVRLNLFLGHIFRERVCLIHLNTIHWVVVFGHVFSFSIKSRKKIHGKRQQVCLRTMGGKKKCWQSGALAATKAASAFVIRMEVI